MVQQPFFPHPQGGRRGGQGGHRGRGVKTTQNLTKCVNYLKQAWIETKNTFRKSLGLPSIVYPVKREKVSECINPYGEGKDSMFPIPSGERKDSLCTAPSGEGKDSLCTVPTGEGKDSLCTVSKCIYPRSVFSNIVQVGTTPQWCCTSTDSIC